MLEKITEHCSFHGGDWHSLIPPNAADALSRGYKIYLRIPLDEVSKEYMRKILQKYKLSLMYITEQELTIIYRPKSKCETYPICP